MTTAILVGAAGELVANGVRQAARLTAEGWTDTTEWLAQHPLVDENDELVALLTEPQVANLNALLEDPRVRALLESRAIAELVLTGSARSEARSVCESSFLSLGQSLAGEEVSDDILEVFWARLESQMQGLFLDRDLAARLDSVDRTALSATQGGLEVDRSESAQVPRWLRDLAALSGNLVRLNDLAILIQDIRRAVAQEFAELRLAHALEETSRPLHKLYVHRTLRDPKGVLISSEDLAADTNRVRVVVTGAPGGGKSTLTQHLLHALSSSREGRSAPLRIQVREMNLDAQSVVSEIARAVEREHQLSGVTEQEVEDLLTLGRTFVVFDGLDEVLDLGGRKRLIRKIEILSHRFPLTSILVTSRDVGYEQAALNADLFTRYRLVPFNDDQVARYATNWFGSKHDGQAVASSFVRDVAAVPDLRENPLMLSLLCTLYKARGHIPRNRRQVYTACADLLFNRWDSMRQIDQPTDHIEHGQDLMQDIALWFFKSSSAQKGVEEGQLKTIIAQFLRDSAGVLTAPANHRAAKFLDFCAGRAWLLGKSGTTETGERLFVFTHRTFMEFFAAEGLARTTGAPDQLAQIICDAYVKNPSSVLPELIATAAEAARRGAARDIVKAIADKERLLGGRGHGRFLPLRLRIAVVLPLQPHILDEMLIDALRVLQATDPWEEEGLVDALLALPRDPQARLLAHMVSPSDVESDAGPSVLESRQTEFLRRWALRELTGTAAVHEHDWRGAIEKLWQAAPGSVIEHDRLLRFYALAIRRSPMPLRDADISWLWHLTRGYAFHGLLSRTIASSLHGVGLDEVDQLTVDLFEHTGPPWESQPEALSKITTDLLPDLELTRQKTLPDSIRRALLALGFGFWEIFGDSHDGLTIYESVLNTEIAHLGRIRDAIVARGANARPRKQERECVVRLVGTDWPDWAVAWALARRSFVRVASELDRIVDPY